MSDYTHWFVGMKVACVKDDDYAVHIGGPKLVKGAVYTISRIDGERFADVAVAVAEMRFTYVVDGETFEGWYRASRFRPVETRKTSIEIFQRLLTPKRETERA